MTAKQDISHLDTVEVDLFADSVDSGGGTPSIDVGEATLRRYRRRPSVDRNRDSGFDTVSPETSRVIHIAPG